MIRNLLLCSLIVILLPIAKCDTFVDDDFWDWDDEANILIYNYSDYDLVIYMDGEYQFKLNEDRAERIDDVSHDEHLLEARKRSDNSLYETDTIDIKHDINYYWYIY